MDFLSSPQALTVLDGPVILLADLPEEILARIVAAVSPASLIHLRGTSRNLMRICLAHMFKALVITVHDDATISATRIMQFASFLLQLPRQHVIFTTVEEIFIDCSSSRHRCKCYDEGECEEDPSCQFLLDLSSKSVSIIRSLLALFSKPVQVLERLTSDCQHRVAFGQHGLAPCGSPARHKCYRPWIGLGSQDMNVSYLAFDSSFDGNDPNMLRSKYHTSDDIGCIDSDDPLEFEDEPIMWHSLARFFCSPTQTFP